MAPANLAGRDGGSGWGLKALADHKAGARLVELPASCHLTYDAAADPKLIALISQVPEELWGAKLALQVCEEGHWQALMHGLGVTGQLLQ